MEKYAYPHWQPALMAVISGIGKEDHTERVMAAEYIIHKRLYELAGTRGSDAEREALQDATRTLLILKRPLRPN